MSAPKRAKESILITPSKNGPKTLSREPYGILPMIESCGEIPLLNCTAPLNRV